jgi:hypothetical protein
MTWNAPFPARFPDREPVGGYPKRRLSDPHPGHKIHPYLLRNMDITAAGHVWCSDIERHEALFNRAVVKGHRLRPVAAGREKLRAA